MTQEPDPQERQKRQTLFDKQKKTLDTLLAHGALSKADYDKSLNGLKEKLKIES
ncbi:MAG: hypothetical protein J6X61_05450 [Clostridia bacterium]|nr:hypothetical protein [Clostridia bacterium]